MAKTQSGLTPKQEAFCQYMVSGDENGKPLTMSDAYREAYDAENMKPATINRKACELMAHGKIAARVESLQSAKDRAVIASSVSHKEIVFTSLLHHVADSDSDSNKIRATVALGQTVPGLFKGEQAVAPERTPAQIEAELIAILNKIVGPEDQLAENELITPTSKDKPDSAVHLSMVTQT